MTKRFPRLTVWSQTVTVADTGHMPYAPQPTYYALHPTDGSHIKTSYLLQTVP